MPYPPEASDGGVMSQVTVALCPALSVPSEVLDEPSRVAVQPDGTPIAALTLLMATSPGLVMVALAVVWVPSVSAGWACVPGTVLGTDRLTVGLAGGPST